MGEEPKQPQDSFEKMISGENYPPDEFYKANCPSGAYNEIVEYRSNNMNTLLREQGTEHGNRLYLFKEFKLRKRLECDDCRVAIQWGIDDAAQQVKKALGEMFAPKDIPQSPTSTS